MRVPDRTVLTPGLMADDLIGSGPADPPFAAPERAMLEGGLEFHRATLLLECDGLDDECRKCRPGRQLGGTPAATGTST